MSKESLKKIIVEIVESSQGLKATELAVKFVIACNEKNMSVIEYDFVELLDEMEREEELVFINYVLPQMDFRLKQFVLPKGTKPTI